MWCQNGANLTGHTKASIEINVCPSHVFGCQTAVSFGLVCHHSKLDLIYYYMILLYTYMPYHRSVDSPQKRQASETGFY